MTDSHPTEKKLTLTNIIVVILSIYVLGALFVETIYVLPKETSHLLNYIDNVICCFFFPDFCFRLKEAENLSKVTSPRFWKMTSVFRISILINVLSIFSK